MDVWRVLAYCPLAFAVVFGLAQAGAAIAVIWRVSLHGCSSRARELLPALYRGGGPMKAVAIALVVVGFIAGCAGQMSSAPTASSDRPDLLHKSAMACEQAGRQWNGTSNLCM